MNMALPNKHTSKSTPDRLSSAWQKIKYQLTRLFSWEIYLILLVASFLHLYQLSASEFDGDQSLPISSHVVTMDGWQE